MEFRISTWNCFGMGQGLDAIRAARAPVPARFSHHSVIAECASPDVMCIQELLSRDAEMFFDKLGGHGLSSCFRDHNRAQWSPATMRGSGLGIASRRTLEKTSVTKFAPPSVGWDRLARKGALYTQITLENAVDLDILNVHLQAGYDAAAIAVRRRQLISVRTLIAQVGARERPFIVCGDFNVDGLEAARGSDEYRRLVDALAGFEDLGAASDLPTFHPHLEGNTLALRYEPEGSTQRLDYVFFRRAVVGEASRFEHHSLRRILDQPLGAHLFASDHFGLTGSFAF